VPFGFEAKTMTETAVSHRSSLLDRPTLVLNKSWRAVSVTTVRRALVLLFRGAASVVHPATYETFDFSSWVLRGGDREQCVGAVRIQIPVPEVVVLSRYDRVANQHLPFTRRNLYRRDHLRCQYCGRRPGVKSLTIDHVVPKSLGGITSWTNCVLACAECHGRKGGRTPEQVGMKLLKNPEHPPWAEALGPSIPTLHAFLQQGDFSRTSGTRGS
jgi:5-methylcytosine-specific restriction endonuclease McrA